MQKSTQNQLHHLKFNKKTKLLVNDANILCQKSSINHECRKWNSIQFHHLWYVYSTNKSLFKVCKQAGYNYWTCTIIIHQYVACLVGQFTCINHLGLSTCKNLHYIWYYYYYYYVLSHDYYVIGMSKRSICPANQKQSKEMMSQLRTNQNTD